MDRLSRHDLAASIGGIVTESFNFSRGRFNQIIRGWINYYGEFYKSGLHPNFRMLNRMLAKWAMRKYKKLRRRRRRTKYWLGRIAYQEPELYSFMFLTGIESG